MSWCRASGKVMHKTPDSARRGTTDGNGRPYRCEHCHNWHVTHWQGELKTKKKWARLAFGDSR